MPGLSAKRKGHVKSEPTSVVRVIAKMSATATFISKTHPAKNTGTCLERFARS
jgi:hypothetical protein